MTISPPRSATPSPVQHNVAVVAGASSPARPPPYSEHRSAANMAVQQPSLKDLQDRVFRMRVDFNRICSLSDQIKRHVPQVFHRNRNPGGLLILPEMMEGLARDTENILELRRALILYSEALELLALQVREAGEARFVRVRDSDREAWDKIQRFLHSQRDLLQDFARTLQVGRS